MYPYQYRLKIYQLHSQVAKKFYGTDDLFVYEHKRIALAIKISCKTIRGRKVVHFDTIMSNLYRLHKSRIREVITKGSSK